MPHYRALIILTGTLLLLLVLPFVGQAAPPAQGSLPGDQPTPTLIEQLKQAAGDEVRISYHDETGKVRFIGTSPNRAISHPSLVGINVTPEEAARGFLNIYGKLFGLQAPNQELTVMKENSLADGRAFVRFQQQYQGIPIVGGELIVQSDRARRILSANGEILPDLDLDITPAITAETARQTALAKVAKDHNLNVADLTASEPELWIYNPLLWGGPGPRFSSLVWRTEVTPLELAPIRELVLIDAKIGALVLNFNQIHLVKNRETYDAGNGTTLPGTLQCNEANPTCTGGDTHEVAAHTYAGDTYDFFMNEHGRDSIDNAGLTLRSTVHYGSGFANAFWNGSQMVYGDAAGYPLGDDVVGHELAHGVTNSTSNLFYYYQSGAINESFSDVWGEFVDQTNGAGTDTPAVRWQMGEDITGLGAIRNMKDPTLFGNPDKITSPNYYCNQSELSPSPTGDNGGVHLNSGVNNKAAYLMTDGDTFNGKTVTGLGYAKVADLYYEVETNLLGSASDYADLYDALIQASLNLGYSAADQQEIKDALDAVEMNQAPLVCPAIHTPVCDSGSPSNLFFDDIESGSGNWVAGSNAGSLPWFVPQTTSTIGLPGPYATSGVGNIHGFAQGFPIGDASDTFLAMKNDVSLPSNAYMHFNQSFGFESNAAASILYDGGILEYSTNAGGAWNDAGSLFTHNGYNGTLEASNPLGAVSAFTADSRGYMSSRLDLSSLAGQNVRFRFRIGTNVSVYDYGWFIDDVRIYACVVPAPEIQMLDGSTDIPDGTGSVNFATTSVGIPITKTFTISNTGTANLTLTNPITVPAGFSLASSFGSTTVVSNTATTFAIQLDATANGSYSGTVQFANNDADENLFDFTVQGTVNAKPIPSPEIRVLEGSTELTDGLSSVDFGSTAMSQPLTKTFTISNTGTANLTLTNPITVPAGFSLASSFGSTTVVSNTATTFAIQLDATANGSYSGTVQFANNDADENLFDFTVSGTVDLSQVYLPMVLK